MKNVPQPMNIEERYLYAMVMRLDALCDMMSSFIEQYAKEHDVATTSHQVEEQEAPKKKRRSTKKDK